ncbi:FAD-binding monooxygenase [Spongiactinospora rosea]|uniref:FAD-binding monooxygenase n=1 Tax=Spongiactinospora rosea TaxID=2248750 RepID=A0A366LP64_9ACTN|nr:FAD-dependent monooxygenase [Spongiactinospora rosea]RBQ15303.1 FAD-binding monooxygenase [Spongiactinospora rosea]
MTGSDHETDVLIIGAGPVGMALALDLTYRNVPCTVVDSGDGRVRHPKVSTIGARSMELFRRWGVAQRIRQAGWPPDHPLDIAWVTQVGGHEIYRYERGTAADRPEFLHTPEPDQVCPAHWLNPLLLEELTGRDGCDVRLLHRLDSFTQDDNAVTAHVTDLTSGLPLTVRARYLVACDGASSQVRRACGIEAPYRYETQEFRNVLFKAPDLAGKLTAMGLRTAMVYFLLRSASLRFPMRSLDGAGLYNLVVSGATASHDAGALVRETIAVDVPVEVLSDGAWHLTQRIADRYRHGRVLLAGDAAHTLSPSGGFGMNTGIADAADLGWKLAALLSGWAGPAMLDSYDLERRPVAVRNLEAANANLTRTTGQVLPADLHADTAAGKQARARMADRLRNGGARREFDAPEIHFGYRYSSPLVLGERVELTPGWRPGSDPGYRAAHAWLRPGTSTLDVFGRGFTLLCFHPEAAPYGLERAFRDRGVPLSVLVCRDEKIAALYGHPYVLVRPDDHVAWRGHRPPDDPLELVDAVRGAA